MNTLENVSDETKISVAVDLLQMVLKLRYPETDEFIEELNANHVKTRRRWYDRNENLHSAIETLKHISNDEKCHLLREILYSIIYFNEEENGENMPDENPSWN